MEVALTCLSCPEHLPRFNGLPLTPPRDRISAEYVAPHLKATCGIIKTNTAIAWLFLLLGQMQGTTNGKLMITKISAVGSRNTSKPPARDLTAISINPLQFPTDSEAVSQQSSATSKRTLLWRIAGKCGILSSAIYQAAEETSEFTKRHNYVWFNWNDLKRGRRGGVKIKSGQMLCFLCVFSCIISMKLIGTLGDKTSYCMLTVALFTREQFMNCWRNSAGCLWWSLGSVVFARGNAESQTSKEIHVRQCWM